MIRRISIGILALGCIALAFIERDELRRFAATLAGGQMRWILAATALQFAYYLANAMLYRESFRAAGVETRFRDLIAPLFGSLVANAVVPSGGAAGAVLFVDQAARRGQSKARAAVGTLLTMIVDLLALTLIVGLGFAALNRQRRLEGWQMLGALALIAMIVAMIVLLMWGRARPGALRAAFASVQRALDRIAKRWGRRPILAEDWSDRAATEVFEAADAVARHPAASARLLVIGLFMHALRWASLAALFPAFHEPLRPGDALAGYAIGMLVWIVAPVPQGIGAVEIAIALVLVGLGSPPGAATAIALTFRGLAFWIPLAVGFALLGRLNRRAAV